MARLYLDHNMSRDLIPLLGHARHDAVTTRDVDGARATDDSLLLTSTQSGRVFITHNRDDFRMLHDAWLTWPAAFGMALPPHPGILVLDQAPFETLARVLVDFLGETAIERLANAIFWWHRREGWRQPVSGGNREPYQQSGSMGE